MKTFVIRMASKNGKNDHVESMEPSPDWSKNIRDVDDMEFRALSRKEQNRLRILRMRKKTTVGRKLAKCAVLQLERRGEPGRLRRRGLSTSSW